MKKEMKQKIVQALTNEGKIIETGWTRLRIMAIPDDACDVQITEMRKAFFAGAHHLFASIVNMVDPGLEATDDDLKRMDQIFMELDTFQKDLEESLQ